MTDKINECTRRQEARTKEEKQAVKKREKQVKELRRHRQKLQEYGNKPDTMADRNSYSKTDPDAAIMRMKEDAMNNGQTKPGYSLQTGTENRYTANFGLYPSPGDTLPLLLSCACICSVSANCPKNRVPMPVMEVKRIIN
jgi:hypothetical protein